MVVELKYSVNRVVMRDEVRKRRTLHFMLWNLSLIMRKTENQKKEKEF